jgi:hypothetical protein
MSFKSAVVRFASTLGRLGVFIANWVRRRGGQAANVNVLVERDDPLYLEACGDLDREFPAALIKEGRVFNRVAVGTAAAATEGYSSVAYSRAAMMNRVERGRRLLELADFGTENDYVIGLDSTLVAGFSNAVVMAQVQTAIRPNRLVVASDIATDFLITDIMIDGVSQFRSPGAIPAILFTNHSYDIYLKMKIAEASHLVAVSVTNQNQSPRNFRGYIVGKVFRQVESGWLSANDNEERILI